MIIYVNKAREIIVGNPFTIEPLANGGFLSNLIRDSRQRLKVIFVDDNGITSELDAGWVAGFAANEVGKYDADPVIYSNELTQVGAGTTASYEGPLTLVSDRINDLLHVDEILDNDVSSVTLNIQIAYGPDDGSPPVKTRELQVTFANDVYRQGGTVAGIATTAHAIVPISISTSEGIIVFPTELGSPSWYFEGGPQVVSTDADPATIVVGTVFAKLSTGFTYRLTGPVPTANYKIDYAVRMN